MKYFVKHIVTIALVFFITLSSSTGLIGAVSEQSKSSETPIADYTQNSEDYNINSDQIAKEQLLSLQKDVEAAGGYVETYDNYSSSISTVSQETFNSGFETLYQTITVMSTPTGNPELGNYQKSVPLKNALVRIDGIPRWTGASGKLTVPMNREYVELYVEKEGYNPYIEIIQATGEEKVVYLKKPGDDIEIYSAMLSYAGEDFNVLTQPCFINDDIIDVHYSELTISANVDADEYYILVNGSQYYYSDEPTFYDLQFDTLQPGDKLSVQVVYQGIESEVVDTYIEIEEYKVDSEAMVYSDNITSVGVDTDEDLGIFGGFKVDFIELLKMYNVLNPNSNWSNEFSVDYSSRTGELDVRIGFQYDTEFYTQQQKKAEYYKKTIENYRVAERVTDNEIKELQSKLKENHEQRKQLNEKLESDREELRRLERQKEQLHNRIMNLKGGKKQNAAYMRQQQAELQKTINDMKNHVEEKDQEVRDLIKRQQNGEFDLKTLKQRLKNIHGFTEFLMGRYNQNSKSLTLGFEMIGLFKYNVKEGTIQELTLSVAGTFEFTWDGMFFAWVIPCYYEVFGGVDLGVEIGFYNEKSWITWQSILEKIKLFANITARGELGVGVNDVLSAGFFAEFNLDIESYAFAKTDRDQLYLFNPETWGIESNAKIGVVLKALLWEWEFGADIKIANKDVTLPRNSENVQPAIMQRSALTSGKNKLSENQLFAGSYQESKPQTVDIGGKTILTWVEDDVKRDDYNRTVLKYSVLSDGVWSEPMAIMDDGNADFYHSVYFDGTDLHIVWQKISRKLTSEDDIFSSGAESEIYYAKFDKETNEFGDVKRITNNHSGDFVPKFALKENSADPLSVVWMKNSENNVLGLSGTNSIYVSTFTNGNWSDPKLICDSENYISFVSSVYKSGILTTAYTEYDGFANESLRRIKVVSGDSILEIANGNKINNSQFSIVDGSALLSFFNGKEMVLSSNFTELETFDGFDAAKIGDDYSILDSENGVVIVYKKAAGSDFSQIYCAEYDTQTAKWTYDISLTNESTSIVKWYAELDRSGRVMITYSVADEEGHFATCFSSREFKKDFAIKDIFVNGLPVANEELSFTLQIENTGDSDLNNISVNAFGVTINVADVIAVGETGYVNVTFMLPADYGQKEKFVVTIGEVVREFTTELNYTDISINARVLIENGEQSFIVAIDNSGIYDTPAILNVYRNGDLLFSEALDIRANETLDLSYAIKDLDAGDAIYFEIIPQMSDILLADNSVMLSSIADTNESITVDNIYKDKLQEAKKLII